MRFLSEVDASGNSHVKDGCMVVCVWDVTFLPPAHLAPLLRPASLPFPDFAMLRATLDVNVRTVVY